MRTHVTLIALMTMPHAAFMGQQPPLGPRWVHPGCTELPVKGRGMLIPLRDGAIMALQGAGVVTSADGGAAWSAPKVVFAQPDAHAAFLLRTREGVLLVGGLETKNLGTRWNGEQMTWSDDFRSDFWVTRSLDEGRTWEAVQKPFPGVYGTIVDIKQMSTGHVVVPVEVALSNPGRWGVHVLVSADQGQTWERSNLIDLGGRGHHDGAIEPTVVELRDGRVYMLIRTTLGRFWEAFSEDHGRNWRELRPSRIDASSAPGCLLRLASGRIVIVWNRLYPEGKNSFPLSPSGYAFDRPVNNHREELCVAFSEDEARTWTQPAVIARQPDASLAYPFVLERAPGELWIGARHVRPRHAAPFAVRLQETDFVRR